MWSSYKLICLTAFTAQFDVLLLKEFLKSKECGFKYFILK